MFILIVYSNLEKKITYLNSKTRTKSAEKIKLKNVNKWVPSTTIPLIYYTFKYFFKTRAQLNWKC